MAELLPWVSLLGRMVVGGVFVLAAVQKLRNLDGFAESLRPYAWLPASLISPSARVLPVAELLLGILLLAGAYLSVTTTLSVALLISLAAVFAINVGPGGSADCGCFGPGQLSTAQRVVVRNLALAALASIAWAAVRLSPGPETTLLLTASGAAILAVFAGTLWRPSASAHVADPEPMGLKRRRFLQLTGGAVAGFAVSTILSAFGRAPVAEAACHGCGTCGTDYIFLYCTGPCCGVYLIRKWNDCDTFCYDCSTTSKLYCGVPLCC